MKQYRLLIDGKMVDGASDMAVINPANEEAFAQVARSSEAQAGEAVSAAKKAFPAWSSMTVDERRVLLTKLADAIQGRAAEFARVLTMEQGKPQSEAVAEVAYTEAFIRYTATLDLPVETLHSDTEKLVELRRKPLGVVAAIIPWNFPLLIIAFKLPSALLAGNTLVIKPSPTTPLTAAMLAELCAEIFPAGVVNTVTDQNDLGGYLTAHPDVAKVSFTGSTETGRKVMASAAATLKRLTLELGGNDAGIVLDDVDVKDTAQKIYSAAFMNCGQVCLALKRAYVHESIYDAMCDELALLAKLAIVDDGLKQGTQIGPLNNRMQFEKVKTFLDDAAHAGHVIAGGKVKERKGFFVEPTIVRDVTDGDRIVDEEQFGPILPVIAYKNIDDVVERVNASDFGLGGSVWSRDPARAKEVALKLECGTAWVNKHLDFGPDVPFGGAKQSGIGVEFAKEGLHEFTQVSVLNMAL
ncbi:aldehyde dehydrogenase family protein [Kordiimonas sp.]|uniref:aldehyde dehydrogenase family protein n=1 Tax=Kordiimonas sp. TaxID=1970157 RepID=UPI003A90DDCB